MRNTNDLQQISELLDEKLAPIHKQLENHGKILESHTKILGNHTKLLESHTRTLESHTRILESHTRILEGHTRTLEGHSKMLKSLKKDQDSMLDLLDREQMDQRKRLGRIEKQLSISTVA